MSENTSNQDKARNIYDDGNIPEIDLNNKPEITEPLPESTHSKKDEPRKD